MRNEIRNMLSANPHVLLGSGMRRKAGRPSKAKGAGVVNQYQHYIADGKMKKSRKLKGGYAFLLPLLTSALAPVIGSLVNKVMGNGRTGGAKGAGVINQYANFIADGKMKKARKSKKGGALSPYQALVKKVCASEGCGVGGAAKYIKAHKLY
jgi:hypothetical protein